MTYFYTHENGENIKFYCDSHNHIPDEATPVSKEKYVKCLNALSAGKMLVVTPAGIEIRKPEPSEEQLKQQWKAKRQTLVNAIVVEIDGLQFNGDETSQTRMARAASLADSPKETVRWILADNRVVEVTADQLRRAAREAGRVQESLWIPPEAE